MNRPRLLVKHHMGMGDHIVHNGMVRKIARDYPDYQICLGTKSHYWENVKYMYRDNPQITVINVGDDEGLHRMCHFEKFDKITERIYTPLIFFNRTILKNVLNIVTAAKQIELKRTEIIVNKSTV